MHEFAIAQRLIDSAVTLLPGDNAQVARLQVQLGALAGLSKDELAFGFEVMCRQTPCAEAKLEIVEMPALVHCSHCDRDYSVTDADLLFCPTCGTPAVLVLHGKELLITSIEIRHEGIDDVSVKPDWVRADRVTAE